MVEYNQNNVGGLRRSGLLVSSGARRADCLRGWGRSSPRTPVLVIAVALLSACSSTDTTGSTPVRTADVPHGIVQAGQSGQGGDQGGNGGQYGGGRDPAVVQACTDLTTLLRASANGPPPESVARRTIRPWNHLQFRRNANLNGDAHLIYADVFLQPPVDQATLVSDLRRMQRDCAKVGFH